MKSCCLFCLLFGLWVTPECWPVLTSGCMRFTHWADALFFWLCFWLPPPELAVWKAPMPWHAQSARQIHVETWRRHHIVAQCVHVWVWWGGCRHIATSKWIYEVWHFFSANRITADDVQTGWRLVMLCVPSVNVYVCVCSLVHCLIETLFNRDN